MIHDNDIIPDESKKQDTVLLPITLPNIDWFQNSFTNRLWSDYATNWSLKIPLHQTRCYTTLWNL